MSLLSSVLCVRVEKKLPLSTDTASNVAIITPQPSKLKKVKVVAPSSPAPKRTKATRHSKNNYQQVTFSPPTPTNTNLPSIKEVFGGASTTANATTTSTANPLAATSFPLAAEQEDCLKVFISKLIAKYTTNSAKYRSVYLSDSLTIFICASDGFSPFSTSVVSHPATS